jgi:hypothetical protein
MSEGTVNGHPRQVWWNAEGETIIESYTITDMAHGTPLGIGDNDKRYGTEGAFLIEAGISSSYQIANFFGLTEWIRRPRESLKPAAKQAVKHHAKPPAEHKPSTEQVAKPAAAVVAKKVAKKIPVVAPAAPVPAPAPVSVPDLAQVLWPLTTLNRPAEPPQEPRRRGIDVGGVITRALTAAGLMK